MKKRHFLLMASIFLPTISFLNVGHALADSDDDNDHEGGHDDHDEHNGDHGENGETDNTDQDTSPVLEDISDEESENPGSGDQGNSGQEHHDPDDDDDHDEDQQKALEAVRTNQAIPFKEIIEIFEKQFNGKIVDVSIYQKRGQLVYRFKYIDLSGYVLFAFYEAATGIYIGT